MAQAKNWKSVGYLKLSKSKKSLVVCIYAELPTKEATFAVGSLEQLQRIIEDENTATSIDLVTLKNN